MRIIGYLRVSTATQDNNNQKLSILDYGQRNGINVDRYYEHVVSSRKTTKQRGIDALLDVLQAGDHLIVSELSRLGRSISEIIRITDDLIKGEIKVTFVKENFVLNGQPDLKTKIMITLFGLFADLEREKFLKDSCPLGVGL